ncbi:MAG: Plug domain-containing protein, partial [Colwellia sp.]
MKLTTLHCAILTALATSQLVHGQDVKPIPKKSKAQIETIEITATKRTESIQDVPVSVSALNGETLEVLGIESFSDYVEFLPNVVFQGTGPGQNEIYIR